MHGKKICHRDLKPDNLLVDPSNLKLKLIDFGCAKVLLKGQPNVSYICSRYYRAPELMFGATEYARVSPTVAHNTHNTHNTHVTPEAPSAARSVHARHHARPGMIA